MKKLILPLLIIFSLTSCSLFRKKDKKPEDKKVFCEMLKDSFLDQKDLDLKKLRALGGDTAYKAMANDFLEHKAFYEESLNFLKVRNGLKKVMIEVLKSKKKSFKTLSSVYGQFYKDLGGITQDKKLLEKRLSRLIDTDFEKTNQEKFNSFEFAEDTPFSDFYAEVVSDFLNDDVLIRLSRPLILADSGKNYSARSVEFRLHGKKALHMYVRSSDLYLPNDKSVVYSFYSEAHNLIPEEQSFYKSLTYSVDGKVVLDGAFQSLFRKHAFKKCVRKPKK